MRQGRIIKGIGGFYHVLLADGEVIVCKARGRFRNERVVPMVGDLALISAPESGYASIDALLPRRNALLRPPVANIDQLVIVAAASAPKPDWLLLDKLILQSRMLGVEALLVLNKLDEGHGEIVECFLRDYAHSFAALLVSSHNGEGLGALQARLSGKVSCFAGQSAVGKSSLLNALLPELELEVGDLAKKTERGKHTTRQAELWPYLGGAVLDTPGFSLFELDELPEEALMAGWPEFGDAPARCRFSGCRHLSEPDCAVKALVGGALSRDRYERYVQIAGELELRRKHRYD